MVLEFDTVVVPLDHLLEEKLKAKAADGWVPIPGVMPVAVYQLCRPVRQPRPAPGDGADNVTVLHTDQQPVN